jgi:hypothetical protein
MAVTKKDLYVSQIIDDLNNGVTWLKKDDLGFGSIEEKYGANEKQIMVIRKHPALKDAETNAVIFNVIDDTKDEKAQTKNTNTVVEPAAETPHNSNLSEEAGGKNSVSSTSSTETVGTNEFLSL